MIKEEFGNLKEMSEDPLLAYAGGAKDIINISKAIVTSRKFGMPETLYKEIIAELDKVDDIINEKWKKWMKEKK